MLEREIALYKRLREQGNSVRFVTYGDRRDARLAANLPDIEVLCNRWGLPKALYQGWLSRKLRSARPQIFKSNQVAGADFALASARRAGAAFVARCGYLLSDFEARKHGESSSQAIAARGLEQRVFSGADRAVVTTAAMQSVLIERYRVDAAKIRVIPNYVQTDIFSPRKVEPRSLQRVGFVGRLEPQKNLSALLEAVAPLDVELLIVGEGPQRAELELAAATSKAEVRFLGNLPHLELAALLTSCDIFIMPSLYEGHPKALLEAMSCGLPVVGTLVPGIQELLLDGKTGVLTETTPDSLRAAFETLLDDKKLRTRLGAAARHFVLKNFSLDRVLDLELALYQEMSATGA
ncbi:MAG: glycosyltransferase family 1 protein [Chloroflexi bacterium]|nr:glycosyltransferase family 1 protein [Chloroflexota bacterium]